MSRKLIIFLTILFSSQLSFAQSSVGLNHLDAVARSLMMEVGQAGISNIYKAQRIAQTKELIEYSLRAAILDESIPYAEIENKFVYQDMIANLAELTLDANGRFTDNSCAEARGMIRLGGFTPPMDQSPDTKSPLDVMTLQTINLLCLGS